MSSFSKSYQMCRMSPVETVTVCKAPDRLCQTCFKNFIPCWTIAILKPDFKHYNIFNIHTIWRVQSFVVVVLRTENTRFWDVHKVLQVWQQDNINLLMKTTCPRSQLVKYSSVVSGREIFKLWRSCCPSSVSFKCAGLHGQVSINK